MDVAAAAISVAVGLVFGIVVAIFCGLVSGFSGDKDGESVFWIGFAGGAAFGAFVGLGMALAARDGVILDDHEVNAADGRRRTWLGHFIRHLGPLLAWVVKLPFASARERERDRRRR